MRVAYQDHGGNDKTIETLLKIRHEFGTNDS